MSKTARNRKKPREAESEESDSYSDDDSDSESSESSESEQSATEVSRPNRATLTPSLRRRRKLDPFVLDSLLWHDLDFEEDFKLFLRNPDDGTGSTDEEEDGPEEPLEPEIVIKTEPKSDDEETAPEERADNYSFILPDVPENHASKSTVTVKKEPGSQSAPKRAKVGPKSAKAPQHRKVLRPDKPRKVSWVRSQPSEIRGNLEKTPFTGKPGRAPETTRYETLTDLFRMFFAPEILDLIVEETNTNAENKNPKTLWTKVTPAELMAFMAINIAMGTDRRDTLSSYWSTYPVLHTPWFGSIMSRQRFRDIHRYLTLDSAGKGPHIFNRIKPLLEFIPKRFAKLNSPSRWLVIDEQVLGTKCKMSYLQNLGLPTRPVEWGLKVFTLSDALTGYVLNVYAHTGRAHDLDIHPHGLAYDIVMKLLENYHGKGHVVFMDNFYTSAQLFLDMLDRGTLACGISRPDRKGFPQDIVSMQLNPGSNLYRLSGDLVAMKWAGPSDVFCMSTYFGYKTVAKQKGANMPEMLSMYNNYMGNINIWDQPMCYFSLIRKPIGWWRKVFWRLVDLTLINLVALRRLENVKLTNTSLRKQLVVELVKPHLLESNILPYEPIQTDGGQLIIPVGHLPIKAEKRGECCSCARAKVKNFCTGCQKYVCTACYDNFHVNLITPDTMEYMMEPDVVMPD